MPSAVATNNTEKIDLRSLEGAWVELRKMNYGELLKRRDVGSSMRAAGDTGKGRTKMEVVTDSFVIQVFEFQHTIMDHNLEDEQGKKLNLHNANDISRLDPVVAQEIEELISERNQLPEDSKSEAGGSGEDSESDSPSNGDS